MAPVNPKRSCTKDNSFNYYAKLKLTAEIEQPPKKVTKQRSRKPDPKPDTKPPTTQSPKIMIRFPKLSKTPSSPALPTKKGSLQHPPEFQDDYKGPFDPQPVYMNHPSQRRTCATCKKTLHKTGFAQIDANGQLIEQETKSCLACVEKRGFAALKFPTPYTEYDSAQARKLALVAVHRIECVEVALYHSFTPYASGDFRYAKWLVLSDPFCVNQTGDVVGGLDGRRVREEVRKVRLECEMQDTERAMAKGKLTEEAYDAAKILVETGQKSWKWGSQLVLDGTEGPVQESYVRGT